MAMTSLILSRDAQSIGVLRRVLADNGILIETCTGAAQFQELIESRKFDAIFVDCDDVDGAAETFRRVRELPSNRKTIAFAIVHGVTTLQQAFGMGSNFVLDKPLAPERILRSLRAAQGLMANERRRYYRHPVSTAVYVAIGGETQERRAESVNLSEGGLALMLDRVFSTGASVRFRFELPGSATMVEGKGEIAWASGGAVGIKFGVMARESRAQLQDWLAKKMSAADALPPVFVNSTTKRYY